MEDNFIESSWNKQDEIFDKTLRPSSLVEFVGQENVKKRLEIFIGAAQKRDENLGHMIFSGPPGLGKTSLANIIAKTMQSNIIITSGPVIEKAGDLAGLLTSLKDKDILFIDEIHRLNKNIEEYLYPAMEDFTLDLLIDSGPNARNVQVKLNKFTLIGATTRSGLLSSPMRSRFNFNGRLDFYTDKDLAKIVQRSASILNIEITKEASHLIASRARGTPRIANNLLKWVRDFCQMQNSSKIDEEKTNQALHLLSIDHQGLDDMDKKILNVIIDHYNGGPVGVKTLGVAIGEEPETISEVYEPYLILKGFVKRTSRGREATQMAYKHMGKEFPEK